jgi:AhpC/TSA family
VRPPPEARIPAPEFPPRLRWRGVAFLRMDRLLGRHAALIEFWDFARINSLRTLPYLRAWHGRYSGAGLQIIGVHSPGYSFGRDPATVERAIDRLEIPYPIVLDPDLAVWRLYGNRGWPGRYLFDRTGLLRYIHYGEGDYLDSELAVQEALSEIDPDFEPPPPLEPLKPEDAPGAILEPQTADIELPRDRDRLELVRDWTRGEDYIEAADAGAAARFRFRAGGAYAVLSGAVEPGVYETDGTVLADDPGLRLHAVQFTPLGP